MAYMLLPTNLLEMPIMTCKAQLLIGLLTASIVVHQLTRGIKRRWRNKCTTAPQYLTNSGIFNTLEQAWQDYHEMPESFTVQHNSETNALQALYFAARLQPGDEVGLFDIFWAMTPPKLLY